LLDQPLDHLIDVCIPQSRARNDDPRVVHNVIQIQLYEGRGEKESEWREGKGRRDLE
jgi:hypothetical protein